MIQDKLISNRYKSEVAKALGGHEKEISKESEVPVMIDKPTGWTWKSGQAIPTGMEEVQTTVPIPISSERRAAEQAKLLRALEGAKAGLPAGVQAADVRGMFPEQGLSFEEKEEIKRRGKVTGLTKWQALDKRTGKPIIGEIKVSRYPPQSTKNVTWDVYGGREKRLGAEARRVATEIESEKDIQQLVTNYLAEPIPENKTQMINAYKAQGKEVIFPETNIGQRVLRWAGISEDPVFIVKDKKGRYTHVDFDETGRMIETKMKKAPKERQTKIIDGKTYIKRNGKWFEK